MITKERAIKLCNDYNRKHYPKEDYILEGLCETKNSFYLFGREWRFNMLAVDKETGKITPDNQLLHLDDDDFQNSAYISLVDTRPDAKRAAS